MQIAICDDNKDVLAELGRQLRVLPQVKDVNSYSSLQAFLSAVGDGRQYDAVLMDIDWNGHAAGLVAAERLEQLPLRKGWQWRVPVSLLIAAALSVPRFVFGLFSIPGHISRLAVIPLVMLFIPLWLFQGPVWKRLVVWVLICCGMMLGEAFSFQLFIPGSALNNADAFFQSLRGASEARRPSLQAGARSPYLQQYCRTVRGQFTGAVLPTEHIPRWYLCWQADIPRRGTSQNTIRLHWSKK